MEFDKYSKNGPYHWIQAEARLLNRHFSPPLLGRYQALRDLASRDKKHVLEIGSGDGCFLGMISENSKIAVGLELDKNGIAWAMKKLESKPNSFLIRGSCFQLPFRNAFFDQIFLADVIEHLDFPQVVLQEISRVLSNDGEFLLSTPKRVSGRTWDSLHVMEYSSAELKQLLTGYFASVEISGCWGLRLFELWEKSKIGRILLQIMALLRGNVFSRRSSKRLGRFGQLLAKCKKRVA